jgi:uncharacterized membrane protein/protein-disulfide isomerase
VLGLALVGLGFASASTWVHYRLLTDPTYISPCDVNASFNCSQAYLSSYGSVAGVPVAIGGMLWFALVAVIAAWSRPAGKGEVSSAGAYIFALSTVALAAVLYLAYASAFVLRTYCLLCIGTYLSVAGIFTIAGLTSTMSITRLPRRFLRDLVLIVREPAFLATGLLFLAASTAAVVYFPKEGTAHAQAAQEALPPEFEKQFAEAWAQQQRIDLGIPPEGAKVVIVKFIDWLCPGCKGYDLAYKPVIDKYNASHPGALKVVIKDWPWNVTCNIAAGRTIPGHEASCTAAVAVRLARAKGKDKEMGDWLFANQSQLIELGQTGAQARAATMIKEQTKTLAGVMDFDLQEPATLNGVRRDVSDGTALNVGSTPTYFINGVRVTSPVDPRTGQGGSQLAPAVLELAIKIELGRGPGK